MLEHINLKQDLNALPEWRPDRRIGPGIMRASEEFDVIKPRGGADRYYRPLEDEPGLWRRLAVTCFNNADALTFVNRFGLMHSVERGHGPDDVLGVAEDLRRIIKCLDGGDRGGAQNALNANPPRIAEYLSWDERRAKFDKVLVPYDLKHALLHQAAESIAGNYQWRQCANEGCPNWFRIGAGAATARREFCAPRCRVAAARKQTANPQEAQRA